MSSTIPVTCADSAYSPREATSNSHNASLENFRHTLDGWNGLLFNDYLNADGAAANSVINAEKASLQAFEEDLAKEAKQEAEQGFEQLSVKSYEDMSVTTQLSEAEPTMRDDSLSVVDFGHRIVRWKPDHMPDQRPCCQSCGEPMAKPLEGKGEESTLTEISGMGPALSVLRPGEPTLALCSHCAALANKKTLQLTEKRSDDEDENGSAHSKSNGSLAQEPGLIDSQGPWLVSRGAWL